MNYSEKEKWQRTTIRVKTRTKRQRSCVFNLRWTEADTPYIYGVSIIRNMLYNMFMRFGLG